MDYGLIIIVERSTGVAVTHLKFEDIDDAEDAREVILEEGTGVDVIRTYRLDDDSYEEVRD